MAELVVSGCGKTALPDTTTGAARPDSPPPTTHRIVIEVTVEGQEKWDGILNNVENVRKALGPDKTQVEVVTHAKGLGMLLATNDAMKEPTLRSPAQAPPTRKEPPAARRTLRMRTR